MAKQPDTTTADGMIVTIDDEVVWDGEGEQLGTPSLVGKKSPVKQPKDDAEAADPDQKE